jgi:uncharacterized protein (DUF1778 family)
MQSNLKKSEHIGVRITEQERELLDEAARLLDRSRGDVVRRALRAFASEVVTTAKTTEAR